MAQLEGARELDLAPLQFREVMAIGRFWAYKFNRVPKYLVDQRDGRGHVMVMPLGGLSGKPLWNEFDHNEYAHMLAASLGVAVERVLSEISCARSSRMTTTIRASSPSTPGSSNAAHKSI